MISYEYSIKREKCTSTNNLLDAIVHAEHTFVLIVRSAVQIISYLLSLYVVCSAATGMLDGAAAL